MRRYGPKFILALLALHPRTFTPVLLLEPTKDSWIWNYINRINKFEPYFQHRNNETKKKPKSKKFITVLMEINNRRIIVTTVSSWSVWVTSPCQFLWAMLQLLISSYSQLYSSCISDRAMSQFADQLSRSMSNHNIRFKCCFPICTFENSWWIGWFFMFYWELNNTENNVWLFFFNTDVRM